MQWIVRAWYGSEPLWKVFWLYTVAPLFAAFLTSGVIAKIDAGEAGLAVRHIYYLKLAVFPYAVFSLYLVYQCRHNAADADIIGRLAMMCCIFWTLWLLRDISLGPHLPPPPPMRLSLIKIWKPPHESAGPRRSQKEESARNNCLRQMNDYALQNRVSPQKYVSDNQVYLQKCTEYYMNSDTQTGMQGKGGQ